MSVFDVEKVRRDFPILARQVRGKPLVYLDNAATSQKPRSVIDRLSRYYTSENSNIHRGVHYLSEIATREYEASRVKVRQFINAAQVHEIIFTRGTTEGINLVAACFGNRQIGRGDEIVISTMEHHSNIVPWQMLCEGSGAILRIVPIDDSGDLDLDAYSKLLNERTRLVALVHLSNALGTINPVEEAIALAHQRGIPVLLDGAQWVPHFPVDVQALDCDFYVFSGHKILGPTGIGVLYGKTRHLEAMPPYQGGGDMISNVTFAKTSYNALPYKFEAGTPHIAGAIGLGVAIDYMNGLDWPALIAYEHELLEYATRAVQPIDGFRIIGTARRKASILSFVIKDAHPQDIGALLDARGVAIRTGHHCAQPLMERFGVSATARASLAFYNTRQEIDVFVDAVKYAAERLR